MSNNKRKETFLRKPVGLSGSLLGGQELLTERNWRMSFSIREAVVLLWTVALKALLTAGALGHDRLTPTPNPGQFQENAQGVLCSKGYHVPSASTLMAFC